MRVPTIGESISEVTLSSWLKANGDIVKLDEPICEFESDKATLEFPAEAAGKLIYVANEGDDLEIGALVAKIDTSVSAEASPSPAPVANEEKAEPTSSPEEPVQSQNYATGHPSPAAKKILAEANVDPKDVKGTGKDGRITKQDAEKAAQSKTESKVESPASSDAPSVNIERALMSREDRKEKLSRMRRTIASRLVAAKNNTAMLTTFNEADMSAIIALRKKYQEKFVEKYGIKLGFMSLFAKACAQVLMEMPIVNATLDGDSHVIYHDYVDVSIAISTPTGLVVPPVHNVESLHFF